MPLPKLVVAGVCAAILGAQLRVSIPVRKEVQAWYWPFLSYTMYAVAHDSADTFTVPELRVAMCGTRDFATVLTADDLGVPTDQLTLALRYIAKPGNAPRARASMVRVSQAVEAQYPGRYCAGAVRLRVVSVSDRATHRVDAPMSTAATWDLRVASK